MDFITRHYLINDENKLHRDLLRHKSIVERRRRFDGVNK
jgi:hypothetical protein